jgi:transcriptional regulator with XRE-family HTH domain
MEIKTDDVNLTKKSMRSISDLIINSRKSKNLTQEQLAELSKVNLRTIQRIENNENTPRGYTLKLICDVLEIQIPNSEPEILPSKANQIELIINYFFLALINLTLMVIIGWTTLDSEANVNSKFAGFLLSFFIPIFIVLMTNNMSKTERLLKFGSGFLLYIILSIIIVGFPGAIISGLLPCLSICLLTLFYGDKILSYKNFA